MNSARHRRARRLSWTEPGRSLAPEQRDLLVVGRRREANRGRPHQTT